MGNKNSIQAKGHATVIAQSPAEEAPVSATEQLEEMLASVFAAGQIEASELQGPHSFADQTETPDGTDADEIQREEMLAAISASEGFPKDGSTGPSEELLASLLLLGENADYTLLPQSLHQIAEAYQLKEDYQWALQFIQLEKLYHERLLSNLNALKENWESQWRQKENVEASNVCPEGDGNSLEHMDTLNLICRTHNRLPHIVDKSSEEPIDSAEQQDMSEILILPDEGYLQGAVEDEMNKIPEEGQMVEETPEEEVKVEWPTGVPQASDKELDELTHTEGGSSPDGLVSILKRRRASLDGLPPTGPIVAKNNAKRKVRFCEAEDDLEHADEVGESGDSCLILLLLCVCTVVISIFGTALYCTLVDTYSNICVDFSQNINFYCLHVCSFFDRLRHWLFHHT